MTQPTSTATNTLREVNFIASMEDNASSPQNLVSHPTPVNSADATTNKVVKTVNFVVSSNNSIAVAHPISSRNSHSTDEMEEVKRKFRIWSQTGSSVYYRPLEQEEREKVFKVYWKFREDLKHPKNLQIIHTQGIVKYTDRNTNQRVVIEYLKPNALDSNIKKDLDAYLAEVNHFTHYRSNYGQSLSIQSKGAIAGPKGLTSTTLIQRTYPMTLEQLYMPQKRLLFSMIANTPIEQRHIMVKRFLMLEELYKKFRDGLEDIIKVQGSQTNANTEDIKKLKALQQTLEGKDFDAAAVAITLGMYPTNSDPSMEEITEAAKKTYNRLNGQFKFEKDPKKSTEKSWAKDIMEMFFINRWDYSEFCARTGIDMKQARLEDVMVNFIINQVAGMSNAQEELKAFFNIQGFSEGMNSHLKAFLNTIAGQLQPVLNAPINPSLFTYEMVISPNANATEIEGIQETAASSARDDYLTLKTILGSSTGKLLQ